MEVNYDAIDGCVNHQKDHPGKALPDPEKKPKKTPVCYKKTPGETDCYCQKDREVSSQVS